MIMTNNEHSNDASQDNDEFVDFLEQESAGYQAGYNPMMGSFSRKFDFPPVPYGHRNRHLFVAQVHAAISDIKFVFDHIVSLEITLYLEELTLFETPERADLDNYAKIICDSLKGINGVLIDDTQIQALTISWIDTPGHPYFEIEFRGNPDDFLSKPLGLYEMPDGLYYPIALDIEKWHTGKDEIRAFRNKALFLTYLHENIRHLRGNRHRVRQLGGNPLDALRFIIPFRSSIMGFHKTRIIDAGFPVYDMAQW